MDGVARQFKEGNPVTDFQQRDDMLRSMLNLGISGYLERLGCRGWFDRKLKNPGVRKEGLKCT